MEENDEKLKSTIIKTDQSTVIKPNSSEIKPEVSGIRKTKYRAPPIPNEQAKICQNRPEIQNFSLGETQNSQTIPKIIISDSKNEVHSDKNKSILHENLETDYENLSAGNHLNETFYENVKLDQNYENVTGIFLDHASSNETIYENDDVYVDMTQNLDQSIIDRASNETLKEYDENLNLDRSSNETLKDYENQNLDQSIIDRASNETLKDYDENINLDQSSCETLELNLDFRSYDDLKIDQDKTKFRVSDSGIESIDSGDLDFDNISQFSETVSEISSEDVTDASVLRKRIPKHEDETKRGTLKKIKKYLPKRFSKINPSESVEIEPDLFKRPNFGISTSCHSNTAILQLEKSSEWRVILKEAGILSWENEKQKHEIDLAHLVSVSAVHDSNTRDSNDGFCFDLVWMSGEEGCPRNQKFGAPNSLMRDIWMQQIFESTAECFQKYLTSDFTTAGWIYIKDGVSDVWTPCWMLLKKRELFYCTETSRGVQEADLRKARCILPQNSGGLQSEARTVLLELQGRSLYLQAVSEKETNRWGRMVRTAALNNGSRLEELQLTRDNVPVLVEKCINFVARQGCVTEGIYRRGGSVKVRDLLSELRSHAWATQMTRARFSEHDVASALRKFFKQLPEPLVPSEIASRLMCQLENTTLSKTINRYRLVLSQLPSIHYVTLKRLLAHLYFLQCMTSRNKSTPLNLATVWAKTIFRHHQDSNQVEVLKELIAHYPEIYQISSQEMEKELKMVAILEKLHSPEKLNTDFRNSGDLRIWISMGKPGAEESVQVVVGPQKSVGEMCAELHQGSDHMLQEFVLGGALRRPLHLSEKVLEVVSRWCYWDKDDRTDNQLVLAPYNDMQKISTTSVSADLKYADMKSKNFKVFYFELEEGKLIGYKDQKKIQKVYEWEISSMLWYLGFEPKRDPKSRWSITFVPWDHHKGRSKEEPFFGHTIASGSEDMLKWCAALFYTGSHTLTD